MLEANCRSIDVSARFGGDEFCILMPHTDPDSAVRVANRIAIAFDEAVAAVLADIQTGRDVIRDSRQFSRANLVGGINLEKPKRTRKKTKTDKI